MSRLFQLARESGCLFPDRVAIIGAKAVFLGDRPEEILAQIRRNQPQLWPNFDPRIVPNSPVAAFRKRYTK